jgi:cytochrome P450
MEESRHCRKGRQAFPDAHAEKVMATSDIHIPDDVAATLIDPAAYAGPRIHETYAWLRANNPLGVAKPEGYDPFWVVTRHADILEISRQNAVFHSGDKATTIVSAAGDAHIRQMTGGSPHLVRRCRWTRRTIRNTES